MGLKTSKRVWQHSQHTGNDLLVLLALADYADDDDHAWPSIPVLAEKARVTERTVYNVLARLEKSGELVVARRRGRGLYNHYLIVVGLDKNARQAAVKNLKATLEKPESDDAKGESSDRLSNKKPESGDRLSADPGAENLKTATTKPESGDANNLKPVSPDPSLEQSRDPLPDQAPAAKPGKPKTPAAVAAFRRAAHRFPAKSWYADIDEAIGEDPAQLDSWEALVKEWVGRGWNPTNVSGMLDAWRSGGIEGKSNGQPGRPSTIPRGVDKSLDFIEPSEEFLEETRRSIEQQRKERQQRGDS